MDDKQLEKDRSNIVYWYVGAVIDDEDQSQRFISESIWENGYNEKNINEVKSIKVGDKIAIKASYTRKNDLPFDNKGKVVSVMGIKAIGTVTYNFNDGKKIAVKWEAINPIKEWYFFNNMTMIWKLDEKTWDKSKEWRYRNLIEFTFNNKEQDIERFLNESYWAKKYKNDETEEISEIDNKNDINNIDEIDDINEVTGYETYTKSDFLKEVFINEDTYKTITSLLKRKKNLILQGAPGVGKTYAAKRIAYSMMGKKDNDKIKMIQFHQSYSYEDFIMGYRPNENGFELKAGPFYEFCKLASQNPSEDYFFIIDEINRGNMSKIFGELLMLIESDKRGEELTLTYSDKPFSVPKNLYIIGMMNTADRSLAIIDYALRRRFSFINLDPAFETESFKNNLLEKGANEDIINRIKIKMKNINYKISKDVNLGDGFKIGHSYFCDYIDNEKWYEEIIKYEIQPLIEEYWFDEKEIANKHISDLLGE